MIKKLILCCIITIFSMPINGLGFNKNKNLDTRRVEYLNNLADKIDEYYKIKGFYPLSQDGYKLPLIVYLNKDIKEVSYIRNNVTVLDYEILIKELKTVLGDALRMDDDSIKEYKNPSKYIAAYILDGNQYTITATLSAHLPLSNHTIWSNPGTQQINNLSKIEKFTYFPGFMNRYSISSISNSNYYQFSRQDYKKLEKNNFKIPKENKRIYTAIQNKDYDEIKKLISQNIELNPINKSFNSVDAPLVWAARDNDIKMAKLFIDAGADVNAVGSYEDSVLIYAMSQEKVDYNLIELLISNGADVNQPNYFGYSPFVGICKFGDINLCKLFIDNGANLNQSFFSGSTSGYTIGNSPLKSAIVENNKEIIKLLVERGADIHYTTLNDPQSPIEFATELGKHDIVDLLKNIEAPE